jgi:hypothetical protein
VRSWNRRFTNSKKIKMVSKRVQDDAVIIVIWVVCFWVHFLRSWNRRFTKSKKIKMVCKLVWDDVVILVVWVLCFKIDNSIFGTPSILFCSFFHCQKKNQKRLVWWFFSVKLIEFFCQHHPDRLPCRFTQRLALWVASSANAKNFNILRRKNS